MKKYITFFLAIIIISCSQDPDDHPISDIKELFEKKIDIISTPVKIPMDSLGLVFNMTSLDNQLIFATVHEPFISVYDLTSDQIVLQTALQGNGPDELPNRSFRIKRSIPGKKINVFHTITGFHYLFHPDNKSLVQKGIIPRRFMDLISTESEHQPYIGLGYFEKRYGISNSEGEIIGEEMDYPLSEKVTASIGGLAMAYQGNIGKHPEKDLFFSALSNAPQFDILSYSNNELKREYKLHIDYPRIVDQSGGNTITVDYEDDSIHSFISTSCTAKYIYLLYSGVLYGSGEDSSFANSILVFDWLGNPVRMLQTDLPLKTITVDENDQTIYGITRNSETLEEEVIRFDI